MTRIYEFLAWLWLFDCCAILLTVEVPSSARQHPVTTYVTTTHELDEFHTRSEVQDHRIQRGIYFRDIYILYFHHYGHRGKRGQASERFKEPEQPQNHHEP